MKFYFCGFEGFGQRPNVKYTQINGFKEFLYHHIEDVIISWSYIIYLKADGVPIFCGSKGKTTNQHFKLELPIDEKLKRIAACELYTLYLFENGSLWKYSLKESNYDPWQNLSAYYQEKEHFTESIYDVACSNTVCVGIKESGELFLPGDLDKELNFPSEDLKAIQVECGREHIIVLTGNNQVLTWGKGIRGQLGNGSLESPEHPQIVSSLAEKTISKVAAGGWHSFALTADGEAYAWGWNVFGQTGHEEKPENQIIYEPRLVNLANVVDVACGNRHSILLTKDGTIYGCGSDEFGQIGINNPLEIRYYSPMEILKPKEDVIAVRASDWTSIIICEEN